MKMKQLKELTIVEQIIDAPHDTVIVVKYPNVRGGENRYADALVKTGSEGYQGARYRHSGYLHHADIQGWFDSYPDGSEFYLV